MVYYPQPMSQVALDTPLFEVLGAKSVFLKRLENLGLKNVRDLLWHFPARYEDFSKIYTVAELEPGQQATIQGVVEEVHLGRSWRKQMSIVEAVIADDTGSIRAIWFNQPYVANTLKVGRQANFAAKVSLSEEGEMYLSHPAYELLSSSTASRGGTKHTARLVPVYPETRGLTSRGLRFIMQSTLKRVPPLKEWIPKTTLDQLDFPEADLALRTIHFPNEMAEAMAAKRRFSFEDLYLLQLTNLQQKLKLAEEKAPIVTADIEKVKTILASLPFELMPSQKKSLWEIVKDIEKPHPMNRLLQGDVGSGKTVVAAVAAMVAADNNRQTAFMAPTEILARQHFETMKGLLARIPAEHQPPIGLITGSSAVILYENDVIAHVAKPAITKKVADGDIKIIFGTHALIQKTLVFKDLGLVIVDEQHRFGVRQRAELIAKKNGFVPHFLSMSATPIPRTLMLTVFGDLDLSLITELPGGRQPVTTKIVLPVERQATYAFIKQQVKEGRQAFVICPRIEPGEESDDTTIKKLELRSVKEEYEKLSKKIFPDLRVDMLHGQMKGREKEAIMKKFKEKEIDVLVSTSVVEVGVDIPNASIMMIEGAERFGLAQLYQFRGRVGRGEYRSHCFLMADKFFGEIQTGLPDVAMSALQDPELVKASREAALAITKADASLGAHPLLRSKLSEFRKNIHLE